MDILNCLGAGEQKSSKFWPHWSESCEISEITCDLILLIIYFFNVAHYVWIPFLEKVSDPWTALTKERVTGGTFLHYLWCLPTVEKSLIYLFQYTTMYVRG